MAKDKLKKSSERGIAEKLYSDYQAEKKGELPDELLSKEYKIFSEKKKKSTMIYEELALFSGKIFKFTVPEEKKKETDDILESFDLSIKAEDTIALGMFSMVVGIVLGLGLLLISPMYGVALILIGVFGYFYSTNYPKRLINIRRSKASTEIILAVLYIVIYLSLIHI